MKKAITTFFLLALAAFSPLNALMDKATGKSFPDTVNFTYNNLDYNLQATGVSTRTKFFVKVYSIAHYMEDAAELSYSSDVWRQIFRDDKAKQFTLIWVRTVNSRTMKEAYMDTFKKNLSSTQLRKLQPQIDRFLSMVGITANTNDQHMLRWIPGGILEVEINGEKIGTIESVEFVESLWGIWLGPKSVVNRKQLVSQVR